MTIDVQKYQLMVADSTPGRFEGETAVTAYFYEAYLNGDGEWLGDYSLFSVSPEEMLAFGLDFTATAFLVRQDDNGFIYGHPATVETVAALRTEVEAADDEDEWPPDADTVVIPEEEN